MCMGCFIATHSRDEASTMMGQANKIRQTEGFSLSERFQNNVGGKQWELEVFLKIKKMVQRKKTRELRKNLEEMN